MAPRAHSGRRTGKTLSLVIAIVAATLAALLIAACGDDNEGGGGLSGTIIGDGSSTVFPISEAVAEEFRKVEPSVRVLVGISGTGGGFKKFCNGEVDFNDASRPIKDSEKQACAAKGIEWEEFQVAFDGLSVMVHPANDFVECLTVEELKQIWEPGSTVNRWKDVRPEWPDRSIVLYGPDTDSGTFDYFTEVIVGEEDASRPDYTASADDNVLVQGIAGDEDALGYFGYAYYAENTDKLKLVAVDGGEGCILPSRESIVDGSYKPLSRPLFVYVRKDALQRPEMAEFMRFYLTEGVSLVAEVGYVEAPQSAYEEGLARIP
ncbi:MAG: PstS family phosphate ABC transporter substrate-binding protein [Dehalococcoidia bacterium]